ncbi:hypothetical protein [Anabaena sp. UHCC 0253]|uniref:hypothetical protein n=1 Tax=Anabaena sp. UHCC 0253 TaxID=2590019 RepID=UPI001446B8E4|nr:hypothetical protein [Anabaena sp. UHCC 0253]
MKTEDMTQKQGNNFITEKNPLSPLFRNAFMSSSWRYYLWLQFTTELLIHREFMWFQ